MQPLSTAVGAESEDKLFHESLSSAIIEVSIFVGAWAEWVMQPKN